MKIQEGLKAIQTKNLNLMREKFSEALSQKAVEKLHEMKQQIATEFLGKQ
jgi:hypothetical protein